MFQAFRKVSTGVLICIFALIVCGTPSPVAGEEKIIKIGVIGPMKFEAGKHNWWGATMAAEEINEKGGIKAGNDTYKIELVKADSNEILSMSDAVTAMERLLTVDKVNFVTGGYLTETVLAMQDVAADNKVIYIGGAGAPAVTKRIAKDYDRYKYYFRALHPNSAILGRINMVLLEMGGRKVREELGVKKPKVALLLVKTKVSDAIAKGISAALPKLGMELAGIWRTSPKAQDYLTELSAIKDSGAHIIATFLSGPTGVVFSKQWGELRIPAVPIGFNVGAYEKVYWERTGGMCEYETLYHMFSRAAVTEKTIPFYDKFVKKTGEYPGTQAGTYSILYLLKEAVERANTIETEAVVSALEKSDHIGPSGKYAFFPKDHKWPHDLIWAPDHYIMVGVQWQDKQLVTVWPDGQPALGDQRWKGVRFKGTKDFKLPPWMVKYWKSKEAR